MSVFCKIIKNKSTMEHYNIIQWCVIHLLFKIQWCEILYIILCTYQHYQLVQLKRSKSPTLKIHKVHHIWKLVHQCVLSWTSSFGRVMREFVQWSLAIHCPCNYSHSLCLVFQVGHSHRTLPITSLYFEELIGLSCLTK